MPALLTLARQIDRFGYAAISDRPMRGGDVAAIAHAERIMRIVAARQSAESVIGWEVQNERDAALWNRLMDTYPVED